MRAFRARSHRAAALLLGLGLFGGGGLGAVAAVPAHGPAMRSIQATPVGAAGAEADCLAADGGNIGEENGADDTADGETDADTTAGEAAEDAAEGDSDGVEEENGTDGGGDDGTNADQAKTRPGELSQGQELLPGAGISPEQAVQAARSGAAGRLGSVELEERNGQLVYEVTVGDDEVFVDAAGGEIVSVGPVQNREDDEGEGCAEEEDAAVAPGTLTEGRALVPRAKLTVEQATAAARGAATGALGEVELEEEDGALLYEVEVGEQSVTVDATDGSVLAVETGD